MSDEAIPAPDARAEAAGKRANAASALSPYRSGEPYLYITVLALILVAIAWIGIRSPQPKGIVWAQVLVLMVAFATLTGRAVTRKWRGILIDHQYRINLSRLQLLAWTVLVLSALFTAVLANIGNGVAAPLDIEVPSELWILLGISTTSAIASPILDAAKPGIASNDGFDDARWADLFMGDAVGKTETVDVGKLQMFFMTFILIISYGAAIAATLDGGEAITGLPPVDDGMNVLLGISQVGYLAAKAGAANQAPQS